MVEKRKSNRWLFSVCDETKMFITAPKLPHNQMWKSDDFAIGIFFEFKRFSLLTLLNSIKMTISDQLIFGGPSEFLFNYFACESELKTSSSRNSKERNEPIQTICPICNAQIITVVRKRWQCKLFSCTFRRSFHFCPACGNVVILLLLVETNGMCQHMTVYLMQLNEIAQINRVSHGFNE
ncbi:hypothetical protein X798_03956 [Onchocerca flexuosa]|uniref:Uncharacterized protein n=1 Tax=Onchocerca flexuosa TaxID=387005 RepID=A0A238BVU3_9BILA|nr:hypothetical protein X798_03956 [Onchocerca flexuosa]